ncbi:hypothetical protein [Streptomyces sp. SP17KL33]|uniref:hypothetical protein n=1 Tax=unclassified Streptomyces TaxID=2593676 RepID=UPI003FCC6BC9
MRPHLGPDQEKGKEHVLMDSMKSAHASTPHVTHPLFGTFESRTRRTPWALISRHAPLMSLCELFFHLPSDRITAPPHSCCSAKELWVIVQCLTRTNSRQLILQGEVAGKACLFHPKGDFSPFPEEWEDVIKKEGAPGLAGKHPAEGSLAEHTFDDQEGHPTHEV